MTYLTLEEVRMVVHLAAYHIRLFLGQAAAHEFQGDAKAAIEDFLRDPSGYSDETLVAKGSQIQTAHTHAVRIELRCQQTDGSAAQVVAKGIWGGHRAKALEVLRKELPSCSAAPLEVRTAGSSSYEFNRQGVNKSLPLRFARAKWPHLLKAMGYTSGPRFNALVQPLLIAADGDGTLYEGPKTNRLPTLKDGPSFKALLDYVESGGVFMMVSGNDLGRTVQRLLHGVPPHVFHRILISANGGADLVSISRKGEPEAIESYRQTALSVAPKDDQSVDIYFVGDDPSAQGNDRPAFDFVGPDRSIVVKGPQDTRKFLEKLLHE